MDVSVKDTLVQLGLTFLLPFAAATFLAFVVRGRRAVAWTKGTLRSAAANSGALVFNIALAGGLFFSVEALADVYASLGLPAAPQHVWSAWPVAAVAVSIIVRDFIDYWLHRLLHTPAFWPIHAVHHSDADMNFTTSWRIHILEALMMSGAYVLFASWLGIPGWVAAATTFWMAMLNKYVHLDIDWGHGRFAKWVSSPRFHRWHHADDPAVYGHNFANAFPVWDVLFGTWHNPGPCRLKLGAGEFTTHDFVALQAMPFVGWLRMARRSVSTPTPAARA